MPKQLATLIALGLASTALGAQAPQQPPAEAARPFDAVEAKSVVEKLATELEDNFVFPEVGKSYAATLRAKLADGSYGAFADAQAFAEAVTRDLQAVHADGHLRLHPPLSPGSAALGLRQSQFAQPPEHKPDATPA